LTAPEIFRSVATNWRVVLLGALLVIMTTVSFYFITAFTPTFGREVLKLSRNDSLIVTLCVGVSNLFWLPVGGAISDRIGRKPLLYLCTGLSLLTAYPTLYWLVSEPSFIRLLLVELWLSTIYGVYNGAMVVYLTEVIPSHVRTAGFSFAYSSATMVGGFTPAVSALLIHESGDRAMAGVWLMAAAACGLVATFLLRPYQESH
jgi:MFS family permease